MLNEILEADLQERESNEQTLKKEAEEAMLFEPILASDGWKRLEEELENTERLYTHNPEAYSENTKLVDFDCGGRSALKTIKEFILKQRNTIKRYVEETNQN